MIPIIIVKTIILENPTKKKIPNIDSIHKMTNTEAISRNGRGSIPTIPNMMASIRRFQREIGWLLIEKSKRLGTAKIVIGIYPKIHNKIRTTSKVKSILL